MVRKYAEKKDCNTTYIFTGKKNHNVLSVSIECFILSSPGRSPEELCTTPGVAVRVGVHIYVKVFLNGLYFPNDMMDVVHVWYDKR